MNRFAVGIARSGGRHAGGKARSDCIDILLEHGWSAFDLQRGNSLAEKVAYRLKVLLRLLVLPKSTVFCIQFPVDTAYMRLAIRLMARRYRTIAVIHDIDGFRGANAAARDELLTRFTVCIASGHLDRIAPKGTRFLPGGNLPAFDYRLDPQFREVAWDGRAKILFAGRLSADKSGWLYARARSTGLLLYGLQFDAANANPADVYGGSFEPANPVLAEPVSFGLVWDGDQLDTCSGPMGEYMRYNYPHKLSLYLALGLPVIIWAEAAAADFVREQDVGLTLNSLQDLAGQLAALPAERIQQMRNNALVVAARMRAGEFLKRTVDETMKVIAPQS